VVGLVHRTLVVHGTRVHAVEAGAGPLVLLVHGFPETWYSWRHQLPALADAGYRAVAVDVRGYGRSSKPSGIEDYRMVCHVADVVGTVEALGGAPAVLVGHDWGAPIAWSSCLLRPELFCGLALLSVPYAPRGPTRPTDAYRRMGGDEEFYIAYFQKPGRAEAEIEPDVRGFLLGFYFTASGEAPVPEAGRSMATIPEGGRMRDRLVVPERLPSFLSEEDLEHYVGEFERGGFTGPLNRYRNVDRDWEDFAAFAGAPIALPSLFVGGERDGPTVWGARAIERFETTLPGLRGCHVLPGCGHWVQQERAEVVNRLLVEFLDGLRPGTSGGGPA
jgi:pimeloyl-ACP methyl ester carboxylesterase